MLLCDSNINVGTKGTLGVIMISYINLLYCLPHYFLLNNTYKLSGTDVFTMYVNMYLRYIWV